jgi:hypothetical protein
MINAFARAAGVPDDTVWDCTHVHKACLLEEILRGRGAAGEFRSLIKNDRSEYRSEYYQKLGWMWFGVCGMTLEDVFQEYWTFFAHPARANVDLKIISEDVIVIYQ